MRYASNSNDSPEILLTKRATILCSLSADRCQHGNERVNEEDQGSVAHEQFVNMRMNNLDFAQLRFIDEALDRIASGDMESARSRSGLAQPRWGEIKRSNGTAVAHQ